MARGTYLQQIARRAVLDTPGALRPRRRPYPVTPVDDAAPGWPVVSARTPELDGAQAPAGAATAVAAEPLAHAAPDDGADRPSVRDDRIATAAAPARGAPASTAPPTPSPPAVTPRRSAVLRGGVPIAPDPLAIALAAAIRWAASEERSDTSAAVRAEPERAAPPDPTVDGAPAAVRRPAPPDASAHEQLDRRSSSAPPRPAIDPRAPVVPAPRAPVVTAPRERAPSVQPPAEPRARRPGSPVTAAAPPAARPRAATDPDAAPFTGIHIGSVEVQILPPAEPMAPPAVTRPTAVSPAPSGPLARGLTSTIGLRQS